MSLTCETIVSEDESRDPKDEELDYEEEHADKDKDEGELDDDEDLEEGEVKEDSDEEPPAPPPPLDQPPARQNSVCRFFGRGQCTWGNNCRFVHPTGGQQPPQKRAPPPLLTHVQPRRTRDAYESESAWERGLKQAKEMLERAHRRKEEDNEFEEKRFHLAVEARDQTREVARDPPRDLPRDSPDARYDNDEYERRRRLAFESAPWNHEPPEPQVKAGPKNHPEHFRDPWRRSKSRERAPKRSHSMSSISGSLTDSSDFSSADQSSSESSDGSHRSARRRPNRKTMSEKKSEKRRDWPAGPRRDQSEAVAPKEYDSWSESLSESESSVSSFYSDDSQSERETRKRPKGPVRRDPPPKRPKAEPPPKEEAQKKSPIKMTFMKKSLALKKTNGRQEALEDEESPQASPASPVSPSGGEKSLQATVSRREELLQQLKAVEDAIRRKKEKIN